jgi:hypothetical protein
MDAGPGAAQIRERDRERLLEKLLAPVDADDVLEDDAALADTLMERMEVRDIALALVRSYRSAMPQPEDLIDLSTEEGRKATRRTGFDDVAWFRMDIGRRQNADPRWLLPLLCRRGHITRNEIGAIRIGPAETYFQVPKAMEERFRAALQRTAREGAEDETGIRIEPSEPPREMARTNRRQGNGPNRPREGFPRVAMVRVPMAHARTAKARRAAAKTDRARLSPPWRGDAPGRFTPRARPAVPAAERAACWPAPRHRHRSLRPPAGLQGAIMRQHRVAQRADPGAAAMGTAGKGFDQWPVPAAVHHIHQLPGAAIAHAHGAPGGRDRAFARNGIEQVGLARPHGDGIAAIELKLDLDLRRFGHG